MILNVSQGYAGTPQTCEQGWLDPRGLGSWTEERSAHTDLIMKLGWRTAWANDRGSMEDSPSKEPRRAPNRYPDRVIPFLFLLYSETGYQAQEGNAAEVALGTARPLS